MTDNSSVPPVVSVLFESTSPRDQSKIVLELVTHLGGGRPPALSIGRTVATGATYRISLSPMLRVDVLEAVRKWVAACDLHEAQPRERPQVVHMPKARPDASSRNGGGR